MSPPRGRARRRGFEAERELARILWSKGFAVVRGPASGARARHMVYPDLVAIHRGRIFVFEVKYRRDSWPLYIEAEQARKLREFARRAGGEALVAVKLPRRGWFLLRLAELVETPGGRLRIDEDALKKAATLDEFVNSVVNTPLTGFGAGEGRPGKLASSGDASGRE